MPYRLWRHVCEGKELLTGSPDCHLCGTHGEFMGWRRGMWEAVAVYQYVYDLPPMGPHRPLADRLLSPLRTLCIRCHGHGILTLDLNSWCACPTCEGTGGIWNRSMEEVETVRRQVLASMPTPQPAPPRPRQPRPRSARSRRPGYSSHGLRFADVERAFAEAERLLGAEWQIKGRGHCRRATLDPRYSRHAIRGAARSWGRVRPHQALTWKRLLPVPIIEKAAEILGVEAQLLMSREY